MLVVFLVLFTSEVFAELVVTPRGPVVGQNEGGYTTFYGVPYAKVSESNPFGVSQPYPNFTTPFQASDPSIKCPQAFLKAEGILQCLRLNIYVPSTQSKNEKIPVLVWFHGGGFFFGSAGDYPGKYLMEQNIILVTVNFRLGPYGFFCLNDENIPGNQGLKDQATALQWIQENISAFNGDPNKVTIDGESYGGGSVELHLYSNFPKNYDKAIIQSGGADVEAIFARPNYEAAFTLAKIIKPSVKREEALKVLAETDPLALMKAFNSSGLILRACKEKVFNGVSSFLTDASFPLNAPEKIRNLPIIIGYNSKENFGDLVNQPADFFAKNQDLFLDKLNNSFIVKKKELYMIANTVQRFYLGSEPVSKDNWLKLVDFMDDVMVNNAAEAAVSRFVSQGGKVYKYLFSYVGNSPYKNITGVGAFHTEELQFLFPWFNSTLIKEDDILIKNRMTTLWANFIKHGDPTPQETDLIPVKWVQVTKDSRPYLNIDLKVEMMKDLNNARVAFWELFWTAYERDYKY